MIEVEEQLIDKITATFHQLRLIHFTWVPPDMQVRLQRLANRAKSL